MLNDFTRRSFSANTGTGHSVTHDIYSRGRQPETIVIMQELPGIGIDTVNLANTLHKNGFRVVMPHLFGPLGRLSMLGNLARVFCMRREFRLFQTNKSSPVVDWLKALCRDLRDNHDATAIGVIGMCLTGNFAISLMADESVLAGVASQPSLPLFRQSELHMSDEEIHTVCQRLDDHGPMMALRFEGDTICTADKFKAIDSTFNDNNERIRLTQIPGNGHSVLTRDLIQGGELTERALDEVISYFSTKLRGHDETRL